MMFRRFMLSWHLTWLAWERWRLRHWIRRVERRTKDIHRAVDVSRQG